MADFDLQRFVEAQAPVFERVCEELRAGRKRTHWMWFVFPQVAGLGSSSMAQRYAIASRAEAEAYLAHPVLGPRLLALTRIVNSLEGRSVDTIFGMPDDMKFHSSMTLFAECAGAATSAFADALTKYFGGRRDAQTIAFLNRSS